MGNYVGGRFFMKHGVYFFFSPMIQWCSFSDVLFTGGRGVSDSSVLKYYWLNSVNILTQSIYESLFVKKLKDNHTHRRTHTRDKHNKNSRNKRKKNQRSIH